ncbi:MAG: GNAT family N-acetyltransferase [Marinospirillum sp.]|uniref:GNAT family N-acetyltransferase n=1 Tax=Marinospirillum sp. TaxID=2183934 RepID=UPI001A010471|nr:GNAT family N-acetyltransferase [Marinospirillum sp.]MBE0508645.1 GNAT family N-acetyltransferase [Marinospirillum sp.]
MSHLLQPETPRLLLRQWQPEDYPAFAALNADPEVMRYFPAPLTTEQSDAVAQLCQQLIGMFGWGFWAVELKSSGEFIGFFGLHTPVDPLPFVPCVEIGWRFARSFWGQGYATEAATAAMQAGFEQLQFEELVSFTAAENQRSVAVMQRLDMQPDGAFEHPALPQGHPLRHHLLYRKSNPSLTTAAA